MRIKGRKIIVFSRLLKRIGETFQAYDYGWKGNLMRYNSFTPMKYVLKKVTAPVFVFNEAQKKIHSYISKFLCRA